MKYLDGELIRVEAGREGSPVSHIVWDSYAGREVRIYPRTSDEAVGVRDAALAWSQNVSLALLGYVSPWRVISNDPDEQHLAAALARAISRHEETQQSSSQATNPES